MLEETQLSRLLLTKHLLHLPQLLLLPGHYISLAADALVQVVEHFRVILFMEYRLLLNTGYCAAKLLDIVTKVYFLYVFQLQLSVQLFSSDCQLLDFCCLCVYKTLGIVFDECL